MTNKRIAVVTGANTGLGLHVSAALARAGFEVIMACRSLSRAESAADQIRHDVPTATVRVEQLDLTDRTSIRRCAASVRAHYEHLNVLVNNAGVFCPPYTMTPNGVELQFDANHVGHFLLTSLLMERLDQPFETRVISVSSVAARSAVAAIHFDNINFEGQYTKRRALFRPPGYAAYAQSKLANLMFAMELHERLKRAGMNTRSIAAHPGVSHTDIGRHLSPAIRLLTPLASRLLGFTRAVDGAQSLIEAATRSDMASGTYLGPTGANEHRGPPGPCAIPPLAGDQTQRARLWALSETLVGEPFRGLPTT